MIVSYAVELLNVNKILNPTLDIYRKAVSSLMGYLKDDWIWLSKIEDANRRFNAAEKLIHSTKQNKAKYDFDRQFYKMPPYFRRSALQSALGALSSYFSNLENWEKRPKGKAPTFQPDRACVPCFYKDLMFQQTEDPNIILLKIYHNKDWVWHPFKLKPTDMKYLREHSSGRRKKAPVLEKKHGKYFLRFALEFKMGALTTKNPMDQTICAVDLGINNDAVCSIMTSNGTILCRKFINFPSEKDHLGHVLNRIKKFQQQHGSHDVGSLWAYATRLNSEHAKLVAKAIAEFAKEMHVDTIVFEYLHFSGKRRGSKKQRLALWRKRDIQKMVTTKAHMVGIRVTRVNAVNTSKLAFDGSGEVKRDNDNYSICTFDSGKRYNADLNASYNIGARFFIRALLESMPETALSDTKAKVPDCQRRSTCTLNTLRVLSGNKAA